METSKPDIATPDYTQQQLQLHEQQKKIELLELKLRETETTLRTLVCTIEIL